MTVGLAFIAIGLVLFWRDHPRKALVASSVGGALLLAGLVIPTLLGPVERAWMGLAHMISRITTPIVMGIAYFLVITPTGYVRRQTGARRLTRVRGASNWRPHTEPGDREKQMERQF